MKMSGVFISVILLLMFVNYASAETRWINDITINEYNVSWNYTEIFSGMDSVTYRIGLDSGTGNNDSFINAWEILKADGEARKKFRNSIEKEPDVKIDNSTAGVEIIDVSSSLSQGLIGKTHSTDEIRNEYGVSYRLTKSIYNASSIWFLGEPGSPVAVIIPRGIDVINVSGMDNRTLSPSMLQGYFSNFSGKGEMMINFTKNTSFHIESPVTNITVTASAANNSTMPATEALRNKWEWIIAGIGIILIILIYIFKIRS